MRPRIFTVPFTRLGDFPELDFEEDETLRVRPLFSQDSVTTNGFIERLSAKALTDETIPEAKREAMSQQIVLDLMALCVIEWKLRDEKGASIAIPKTPADLLALPAGLAGAFFTFFSTYRGEEPNPTTGS